MSTFVSVGNAKQSFNRLINVVLENENILSKPIVIQHGHTTVVGDHNCTCFPFLNMNEFSQFIHASDILIMHAGAGSLIHAIQEGKIPVIMPRLKKYDEHIDDHQVEFAQALSNKNKAIVMMEPNDLISSVNTAKKLQNNINTNEDNNISFMHMLIKQAISNNGN
jgi:exopolysaccharide biosynthesis glucuronosyltransferase PssE